MTSRKKRLEKGIASIEEQIRIYEEKRGKAQEEGEIELDDYYQKEIKKLGKEKEKKERLLGKG